MNEQQTGTLEKNADTVTSQRTRDVVTTSVTSISEALQVVRLISHIRMRTHGENSDGEDAINLINETLYASIRTHRILHLTSSSLSSGYKSFAGILWSSLSEDTTQMKNPIVSSSLSSSSFKEEFNSAPLSVLESLCWILRNMSNINTEGAASARSILIDAFVCVAAEWNRSQRGEKQERSLMRMLRLLVNSFCMNSANDSMCPVCGCSRAFQSYRSNSTDPIAQIVRILSLK